MHRSEHVTRLWRSDVCERSSDDQRNVVYSTKLNLIDCINRGIIVDNQVAASIYRSRAARSVNRATITTAKTTNRKYRFAVSNVQRSTVDRASPDRTLAPLLTISEIKIICVQINDKQDQQIGDYRISS